MTLKKSCKNADRSGPVQAKTKNKIIIIIKEKIKANCIIHPQIALHYVHLSCAAIRPELQTLIKPGPSPVCVTVWVGASIIGV